MNADEQLVVYLEARVREFEKRMIKAERTGTRSYKGLRKGSATATKAMERDMLRSTTRINQALATTSGRIGKLGAAFKGGLAVGAITAGITGIARGARNATRQMAILGDEAKRAGVSIEAFQEFKFIAEQNRIGLDQMVDGLKELNLRADEFVVTGKGPAAEAFDRLGFGAADLAKELERPDQLMLKIIGRLGDLDRAAQIRIADEVFGGSAGEMFVQLIDQGEASLRQTAERAHEVGAVLEDDVIRRAQELDRRFAEIQTRMSSMFKTLVVNVADFAATYEEKINENLDQTLAKMEKIEKFDLGAVSLDDPGGALDEAAAAADELDAAYETLVNRASHLRQSLTDASFEISTESADTALEVFNLGSEIESLIAAWAGGKIGADEFSNGLEDVTQRANDAVTSVDGLNDLDMSNIIAELGGITTALSNVAAQAVAAARAVLSVPTVGDDGTPRVFGDLPAPPTTSTAPIPPGTRPKLRPDRPKRTGRGGGGGGSRRTDGYADALEATRIEIRQLEAETTALIVLAETGQDVGDALEYASKRAELMNEALAAGKKITPELQAEIDGLAESYARAGESAEQAADGLSQVEDQAEAGSRRLADMFTSILDGSKSAKDAVKELIAEMARININKGLQGLFKETGIGESFGKAFGGFFADGGTLGAGQWGIAGENGPEPVVGPAKIISNRDAFGGPSQKAGEASRVIVTLDHAMLRAEITQGAGEVVQAAKPALTRAAVGATDRAMRETSAFGGNL